MAQKPNLNSADLQLISKLFDKRFESIDKRFENIDKRFQQLDKRFDTLPEQIENIARQVIREEAVTKDEFEERIKHLPTKDEFYASQDKVVKELKTTREEQAAHMALHTS